MDLSVMIKYCDVCEAKMPHYEDGRCAVCAGVSSVRQAHENRIKRALIDLGLYAHEIGLFLKICDDQNLPPKAILRQALRLYQAHEMGMQKPDFDWKKSLLNEQE